MSPDKEKRPATLADIKAILAQLQTLRAREEKLATAEQSEAILAELERLRAEVATLKGQAPPPQGSPPAPSLPEQMVTLDQIGALVHRSKRSMERYRRQMPAPRVRGRRGQSHLWAWAEVRPWLERTFHLQLPEQFPGHSP